MTDQLQEVRVRLAQECDDDLPYTYYAAARDLLRLYDTQTKRLEAAEVLAAILQTVINRRPNIAVVDWFPSWEEAMDAWRQAKAESGGMQLD